MSACRVRAALAVVCSAGLLLGCDGATDVSCTPGETAQIIVRRTDAGTSSPCAEVCAGWKARPRAYAYVPTDTNAPPSSSISVYCEWADGQRCGFDE